MMVLVAIVVTVLAIVRLTRQWQTYGDLAAKNRRLESAFVHSVWVQMHQMARHRSLSQGADTAGHQSQLAELRPVRDPVSGWEAEAVRAATMADHFARLATKYERAVSRPWLPVEPDPPPPVP
jgi:hypothetical protein